MNNKPNILSLNDTIALIEIKYGKEWKKNLACITMLIYASTTFTDDHFEDIWKEHELPRKKEALEYREKGTINGKPLPNNFSMALWDLLLHKHSCYEATPDFSYERVGSAPLRDSYFEIKEEPKAKIVKKK